jgi:ATP-dependent Clp protease adaptor protein ClpS
MSPRPGKPRHDDEDGDSAVVTQQRTEHQLKRPRLYKVLLHNDHYTTMEFVVAILIEVFHKSESDATTIMLHVHKNGVGVAGVYTREIAETKVSKVLALAKEAEYPLMCTCEPEEDGE